MRRLIEAAESTRDRAIIAILAETGMRVGELCSLRLRDVQPLDDGSVRLRVRGKTGVRALAVFEASRPLLEYLRDRHGREPRDPDAPLFLTVRGTPLTPKAVRAMLARVTSRAGLGRGVHPHMLRHTRMTELAHVLTEQELKVVAGWSMASRMAAIYVHLSGRDAEAALRRAHKYS